ncbi:HNH endonuclease signature motif containing protein [Streptomyces sp. NPDC006655]|uniref:HNH endonuclease n=1 Tax=Streptomyces sp. NPDC006655 TaxID=3156898 RepID=UPI003454FDF3
MTLSTLSEIRSRPRRLTADQIVPLSRGGTNDIENLRPACGPCNFSRGNRTP